MERKLAIHFESPRLDLLYLTHLDFIGINSTIKLRSHPSKFEISFRPDFQLEQTAKSWCKNSEITGWRSLIWLLHFTCFICSLCSRKLNFPLLLPTISICDIFPLEKCNRCLTLLALAKLLSNWTFAHSACLALTFWPEEARGKNISSYHRNSLKPLKNSNTRKIHSNEGLGSLEGSWLSKFASLDVLAVVPKTHSRWRKMLHLCILGCSIRFISSKNPWVGRERKSKELKSKG